jgi:hypothetical protein
MIMLREEKMLFWFSLPGGGFCNVAIIKVAITQASQDFKLEMAGESRREWCSVFSSPNRRLDVSKMRISVIYCIQ